LPRFFTTPGESVAADRCGFRSCCADPAGRGRVRSAGRPAQRLQRVRRSNAMELDRSRPKTRTDARRSSDSEGDEAPPMPVPTHIDNGTTRCVRTCLPGVQPNGIRAGADGGRDKTDVAVSVAVAENVVGQNDGAVQSLIRHREDHRREVGALYVRVVGSVRVTWGGRGRALEIFRPRLTEGVWRGFRRIILAGAANPSKPQRPI
jgi:hypothetical protein